MQSLKSISSLFSLRCRFSKKKKNVFFVPHNSPFTMETWREKTLPLCSMKESESELCLIICIQVSLASTNLKLIYVTLRAETSPFQNSYIYCSISQGIVQLFDLLGQMYREYYLLKSISYATSVQADFDPRTDMGSLRLKMGHWG